MGAFGGWEMPIEYTSIVRELLAIHNSVGVFKVRSNTPLINNSFLSRFAA